MTHQSHGLQLHLWARVAKTRSTTFMASDGGGEGYLLGWLELVRPSSGHYPVDFATVGYSKFWWDFHFFWSHCPFLGASPQSKTVFCCLWKYQYLCANASSKKCRNRVGQLLRCANNGIRWHYRAMWTNTLQIELNPWICHSSRYLFLSLQPK